MRVKICGITNLEDAIMSCKYGADALGFIFYKKSPRYISPEDAFNILKRLSPFVMKIGVFVNEKPDLINRYSRIAGLNGVQLHGDESPPVINEIELPVIKSFRIDSNFNFEVLNDYINCHFLLDTNIKDSYGGTGESFNWDLIPQSLRENIILAGGISSGNIEHIIKNIRPMAVDLSSSVEKSTGKKDEGKMREFFQKINDLRCE